MRIPVITGATRRVTSTRRRRVVLAITCLFGLTLSQAHVANAHDRGGNDQQTEVKGDQEYGSELPEFIEVDGIDVGSVRLLIEQDGARHWTARRNRSEVCLISMLEATGTAAVTCDHIGAFRRHGLTLRLGTVGESDIEMHLVPSRYSGYVDSATAWDRLAENLFSSDPRVAAIPSKVSPDGQFVLSDLGPNVRPATDAGRAADSSIGDTSTALATVKYSDGLLRRGSVEVSSHAPYSGVPMTGSHAEISERFPVHTALVGTSPPHHPYSQADAIKFVRIFYTTVYAAISRCWWDSNGYDFEQPLHCWYSR